MKIQQRTWPVFVSLILLGLSQVAQSQAAKAVSCDQAAIDRERVAAAVQWVKEEATYLDVFVVSHCGKVIAEHYANGAAADKTHDMQSATKTFPALLVGIALDLGLIKSVEQPVVELLPQYAGLLEGDKKKITLRHLLEMTSGLKWVDFGAERSFEKQAAAEDSAAFVLGEPLVSVPGDEWFYNTGSSHLLSAIIHYNTGMSTAEFAEEHLFGPLEFGDYEWRTHRDGVNEGGWQLYLRPEDSLKIGEMLLNQGTWNGKQIVSGDFVREASKFRNQSTFGASGYGYQMWIETDYGTERVFGARGWGGQNILVAPKLQMVIVTNGSIHHPRETAEAVKSLITDYLVPAHRLQTP